MTLIDEWASELPNRTKHLAVGFGDFVSSLPETNVKHLLDIAKAELFYS